jgi:GntR family transcriptional regulator/MocR family aminotransferase
MIPALRLAYLIVPRDLIHAFLVTRFFASRHPPRLEQAALARFITKGHLARRVRRIRALYARRQQALIVEAQREATSPIRIEAAPAGLHLLGHLPPRTNDSEVSRKLAEAGIDAAPLSAFAIERNLPPALILGYAGITERAIRDGVRRMQKRLVDGLC